MPKKMASVKLSETVIFCRLWDAQKIQSQKINRFYCIMKVAIFLIGLKSILSTKLFIFNKCTF